MNHLQQKLLEKCIRKNLSMKECYEQLQFQRDLCIKLDKFKDEVFARKTFKKSVMVVANYGGTQSTSRADVVEQLKAIDSGFLKECSKEEIGMFCDMVFWSMSAASPAAMNFLDYFRKLISFSLKYKDSVYYNHPLTGFPIHLCVKKKEQVKIDYKVHGKSKKAVLTNELDETNTRKTTSSSVPSITHSTDAAILLLVKHLCLDIPMSYIHDSVGMHPNNIRKGKEAVKTVLSNVVGGNIYQNIRDQLLEGIEEDKIPEELKQVPYVGDWDNWHEDIMNAEYAFM